MFSYPSSEEVLADLGEKVVEGIGLAVRDTRRDFERYRTEHPGWVSEASERGLANWLHDRLWSNLLRLIGPLPDVDVLDAEPTREMTVRMNYRVRAKRHSVDGVVNSYPTQSALDFLGQSELALPGLELVHLVVGYVWIKESHVVGPAVVSLHDGRDETVWMTDLPEPPSTRDVAVVKPSIDQPPSPRILFLDDTDSEAEAEE